MTDSDAAAVVIRGGTPLGHRRPVDVEIVDGRITRIVEPGVIDAGSESGVREVIEAGGCLLLPGLVDAHCHLDKTLYGRPWVPHTADDTLQSRISNDRQRRTELGLPDPDAIRALLHRMADCGTTLVRTHTDVDPDIGLTGIHRVAEVGTDEAHLVGVQQVAFPQHGLLSLPGTRDLMRAALAEGATVVGGLDPGAEGDAPAYLDTLFSLAEGADAGVDVHLHGRGEDGAAEIEMIVERTRVHELGGRVAISHAYCFGDLSETRVRGLAERLAEAGVGVVTAAVYSFPVPPPRILKEAGAVLACGHDGIRDLWGPYGTGDMLDRARQVAYRSGFRSDPDIGLALHAATSGGRRLITGTDLGVTVGDQAELVVVPAQHAAEAVVRSPFPRTVIRGSRVQRGIDGQP